VNIESSINWWFYKDLQLPSQLLQVHQKYQVLPINGHFSKWTTNSICNTPLLHKHHKIVLCVVIFEPCNYPSCDLFFKVLHNICAMYKQQSQVFQHISQFEFCFIPQVSNYFPCFQRSHILINAFKFFYRYHLLFTWVLSWFQRAYPFNLSVVKYNSL
jgi:hypothetical protein